MALRDLDFDEMLMTSNELTRTDFKVGIKRGTGANRLCEGLFNDADIEAQTDLLSFYKEKCNLPVTCNSEKFH